MNIIIFEDESVPYIVVDMLDLSKKDALTDLNNVFTLKENLYREAYLFKVPKSKIIYGIENPTNDMIKLVLGNCGPLFGIPAFNELYKQTKQQLSKLNAAKKPLSARDTLNLRILLKRLINISQSKTINEITVVNDNKYYIQKDVENSKVEEFKIVTLTKEFKSKTSGKVYQTQKDLKISFNFKQNDELKNKIVVSPEFHREKHQEVKRDILPISYYHELKPRYIQIQRER